MFSWILSVLVAGSSAYANVNFEKGDIFNATSISGQVHVTCSGFNGQGTASFVCRDIVLDPSAYSHVRGIVDSRIEKVELTSLRADSSTRVKVLDYDGKRGRSAEAANLWISTIFQKPLLLHGRNIISYKMTGRGMNPDVYYAGSFEVQVNQGEARQCRLGHYQSSDVNDCNSPYSICQRYFQENKNCQ